MVSLTVKILFFCDDFPKGNHHFKKIQFYEKLDGFPDSSDMLTHP